MLIEFSVKNFLSFKNKVTLSMEKGNGDENLGNIISTNNIDLLKTAAIYGAVNLNLILYLIILDINMHLVLMLLKFIQNH